MCQFPFYGDLGAIVAEKVWLSPNIINRCKNETYSLLVYVYIKFCMHMTGRLLLCIKIFILYIKNIL